MPAASKHDFMVRTTKGRVEAVNEVRKLAIRDFVPDEHFSMESTSTMSPTILVNGKRGSGKSIFVRWLLGQLGSFQTSYAVVPTGKVDDTVIKCFPPVFREYDLVETKLSSNFEKQKSKAMAFKSGKLKDVYRRQDIRHLYVLDDCISKKDILRRSNTINQVMLEGRHYYATFVLTSQDVNAPTPAMRQNFDWVFLLRTNSTKLLKTYYDYYADFFDSFELFKEVFKEVTKNFGVMAINNKNQNGDIEDIVFRAKADINDRPKLCLPQFWDPRYISSIKNKRIQAKRKEEEKKLKKTYIPVTTVHKKIGYKIKYPDSSEDHESTTDSIPKERHRVSFADIIKDERF